MISIVICSRNFDISDDLKRNISQTIGVSYELVVVDNSHNNYSIFSAYNEGLKSAKGDLICFMHEDILFHTFDWGRNLEQYFMKYPEAGMVGVAGTHYLPQMPAAWWDTEIRSGQLIQGSVVDGKYRIVSEDSWLEQKSDPTIVVSVDGLWMCFKREVFDSIRWDDCLFKGFHGYDTDISLQVWNSGFEVHIFWDLMIEHKSSGNADLSFYESIETLYVKWRSILPMIKGVELSEGEQSARKRIAELRHELFYSNYKLSKVCSSRQYRWGQYLQKPSLAVRSIWNHILKH